ncbi:Uncharacterised protein [Dermatophilus congolensis]|uniref:Uncharacterized protein n=1 Tax=Dermatophilus congolensis TaxID=1863 RepID=A0AA46H1L1_9MICO|nr:Uncharacterised protein [Dermatophilus congolensis]
MCCIGRVLRALLSDSDFGICLVISKTSGSCVQSENVYVVLSVGVGNCVAARFDGWV